MIRILLTVTGMFLCIGNASSQVHIPDSIKYRSHQYHYQQMLGITPAKALEVARAQGSYLDSLTALYGRFEQVPGERLQKQHALDSLRREKLKLLLTPQEFEKFRRIRVPGAR